MNLIQKILNSIYPNRCPFCNRVLSDNDHCADELDWIDNQTSFLSEAPLCNEVFVPFFYHQDVVQRSILKFKFYNHPSYSVRYAQLMTEALFQRTHPSFDLIAHVPFYRDKQDDRGYDTADLLARELSIILKIPHDKYALTKTHSTVAQHTLTGKNRRVNLADCFSASASVHGKVILLCDDVITTGTTMNECGKALRAAGAKQVYGIAIATTSSHHKLIEK